MKRINRTVKIVIEDPEVVTLCDNLRKNGITPNAALVAGIHYANGKSGLFSAHPPKGKKISPEVGV